MLPLLALGAIATVAVLAPSSSSSSSSESAPSDPQDAPATADGGGIAAIARSGASPNLNAAELVNRIVV